MSKLEFYLNQIVHYGLYAILLTPLAFWKPALYPFAAPKFLLFQILVEIVFGAWLALIALGNTNTRMHTNDTNDTNRKYSHHSYDDSRHSYWRKWLIIALLIFFGVSFLSAIFGVDFSRSFWGIGARMTGLFAELHFFAWFLVLASSLGNTNDTNKHANDTNRENNKKNIRVIRMPFVDWYYYLNFSFAVSILVALSAFYQNPKLGMAFGGTVFNNPTFVAPYLIFHFFWGLYETIFNFQFSIFKLKRWVFGAASVFLAVIIFLLQVRGAFLGFLLGLFFLGILLLFIDVLGRRGKIILTALGVFILAILGGIRYFNDAPFIAGNPYLNKISQISLSAATAQSRLLIWGMALKSISTATILGAGPENFNYLANLHYDPHLLRFGFGGFNETWPDKPHNAFLEVITETGILGALAYALIWIATAVILRRIYKTEDKILSPILIGAFAAYLGSVFFAFDSFGSWFGLYLMLGFLASHNNTNDNSNTNTRIHANDANKRFFKNIFVSFACGILFVLLYVNYGIWRANLADAEALRIFSGDTKTGIALFGQTLNYWTPYKSEYQFDFLASVVGAFQKNLPIFDVENTINFALAAGDDALAAHPKNAASFTDMAQIYMIIGEKGGDLAILAQAEVYGRQSLELSPKRQETLFYLARIALLENNADLAVEWTKQAIDADPTIKQSHWYFGLALIADGQKTKGVAEIKKALELGYRPQNKTEENFIKNLGLEINN